MARSVPPEITIRRYENLSIDDSNTEDLIATEEELQAELNKENRNGVELGKTAVQQSRRRAILESFASLIPVGISFCILQLSFRDVFWRGTSGFWNNTNELLGWLQVASKAHEILIVMSLSWIVMHHLRKQLISDIGVPFGLFVSAYRATLGTQPFSYNSWYPWKVVRKTDESRSLHYGLHWKAIQLTGLLFVVSILMLVSGPASANAYIPRLDWWPYRDLFVLYRRENGMDHESADFSLFIPKQLFPIALSRDNLPGDFCFNSTLDIYSVCLYAGFSDLLGTVDFTVDVSNDTISSSLGRTMSTSRGITGVYDSSLNSTATSAEAACTELGGLFTWTSNYVFAGYLSLGRPANLEEPYLELDGGKSLYTVDVSTQSGSIPTPRVDVFCSSRPSSTFKRDLIAVYQPGSAGEVTFDLRDLWDETTLLNSSQTLVQFREISLTGKAEDSVLTAFILSSSTSFRRANVSICSIQASYAPTYMGTLSTSSHAVVTNFSSLATHNERQSWSSIKIGKTWADSLNAASSTSNSSLIADYLDSGLNAYHHMAPSRNPAGPSYAYSILLSRAIADSIARIGSEYSAVGPSENLITVCSPARKPQWCGQDFYPEYSTYLDNVHNDTNILTSIPVPDDIFTQWTPFSMKINRYGYGWSFRNGATIKIAAAVLILHAFMIFCHIFLTLIRGQTYSYAGTLGELISLALNSTPPKVLRATSVGISTRETWMRPVVVREVAAEDSEGYEGIGVKLSLVLDEQGGCVGSPDGFIARDQARRRRVVPGQRYD